MACRVSAETEGLEAARPGPGATATAASLESARAAAGASPDSEPAAAPPTVATAPRARRRAPVVVGAGPAARLPVEPMVRPAPRRARGHPAMAPAQGVAAAERGPRPAGTAERPVRPSVKWAAAVAAVESASAA